MYITRLSRFNQSTNQSLAVTGSYLPMYIARPSTFDKSKSCIYTNNGSYLPVYVASRIEIISWQTKVLQLQEYRYLYIYMYIATLWISRSTSNRLLSLERPARLRFHFNKYMPERLAIDQEQRLISRYKKVLQRQEHLDSVVVSWHTITILQ